MIKVSASNLDSYLKYIHGAINEDMLIVSLLSYSEPSLKMQIGTEFHSSIEDIHKPCKIFNPSQLQAVREQYSSALNNNAGVHEMKVRGIIDIPSGQLVLTGMADLLNGLKVVEFKTTFGSFDIDRYFESIQWQVYLHLFGTDVVEYVVFQFPSIPTALKTLQDIENTGKPLEFTDKHVFSMHKSMLDTQYLRSVCAGLYDFIKLRGIESQMTYDKENDTSAVFIGDFV
jgi:hypothetical protein